MARAATSEMRMVSTGLMTGSGIDTGELAGLTRRLRNAVAERAETVLREQAARQEQEKTFDAVRSLGLVEWGQKFLPNHFQASASSMHLWLSWTIREMQKERGRRFNVVGPRGSAKSTIVTLAGVLRASLEPWEPYIWIVSDTKDQAGAHLDNLRRELLENDALQEQYGGRLLERRRSSGNRLRLTNGVVIEAYGTGQRIRGRRRGAERPTWIVCDDLEGDAEAHSSTLREQLRRWFEGTLLKAGTKRTNVMNLGTAIHRDGLATRLLEAAGWESRVFRAVERWPAREDLWKAWEEIYTNREDGERTANARKYYEARREAMHEGAKVLWESEQDLYMLMRMQVEGGRTSFLREMQGESLNSEDCEWPGDYFGEGVWFDTWPDELTVKTMALDPSKGVRDRRGDFSAIVMLGRDHAGRLYVQADLEKRPTQEMVERTVTWCGEFAPDALGVEVNQFQELLVGELTREMKRQCVEGVCPWTFENTVNKAVRIRRLGPLLSSGRLRFKSKCEGTRLLVNQLRDFPAGDHDDGPDALEMAVRLMGAVGSDRPSSEMIGGRLVTGERRI